MGVSRATYYWWKVNLSNGMRVDQHGNVGTVKLQTHTLNVVFIKMTQFHSLNLQTYLNLERNCSLYFESFH
jgi:hypothetical protein